MQPQASTKQATPIPTYAMSGIITFSLFLNNILKYVSKIKHIKKYEGVNCPHLYT